MSDNLEWIRDSLDRIETGQKEGFEKINGRVKALETSNEVHEYQLNGKDGLHDRTEDNEKKIGKIDKRTLVIGLAIVGGTTVGTNLGPIGDLLKSLI